MRLITFPIRLIVRTAIGVVVVPLKVILATAGFTFRAGVKVGEVPVRTGSVAVRRLGVKALVVLVLGVAVGFVIGQRFAHLGHDHDHDDEERFIDGHAAPTLGVVSNADVA